MNRHVSAIAGRQSLRPPQRRSLEILDRLTEIAPPRKGNDLEGAPAAIRDEFPTVTDFPSLLKWFKPPRGQFQIYYRSGGDHLEYQPDFVAEADGVIYMLEPKARSEMDSEEVLAKKDAAARWCKHASDYAQTQGGKPWQYVLIPHDAIMENMTLSLLASQFAAQ